MKALINLRSKVHGMQPSLARKSSVHICESNISAEKIDGSILKTYGMVITLFHMDDKDVKFCFFAETFILANISMNITFGMSLFTLSNIEVNFNNRELKWRFYIIAKAITITRQLELVNKKSL